MAKPIEVVNKHGIEGGRKRIEAFADGMIKKYGKDVTGLEKKWSGNTYDFGFSYKGAKFSGKATVKEKVVELTYNMPTVAAIASVIKGNPEDAIRTELQNALK